MVDDEPEWTSDSEDAYDSDEDADYDPELEGVNLEDRAKWIEEHHEELTWLWDKLKTGGMDIFGNAWMQNGNFGTFCYFAYKYTMP